MARRAFPILITLAIAALLISAFPRGHADRRAGCLWDRDTLRHEALGLPEVMAAITGRFDRFPPLYYEMRLAHVAAEIDADPTLLDRYDDAGVACDRLGRHDEAIEWMARKAEQLTATPDVEHRYRYLANLGTFHAHRWISNGADRSDLSDLETAERLIAEAIELNPDAHFGRERYQLLAIRWLHTPPPADETSPLIFSAEGLSLGWFNRPWLERGTLRDAGYADAAEGLAGLIVLGNAWSSPDIFAALRAALIDRGDASVAYLAFLRAQELLGQGRTSLHPDATSPFHETEEHFLYNTDRLDSYYESAMRSSADWHAAREAYLLAGLREGRHPDTDATFWAEWQPVAEAPRLPGVPYSHSTQIGVILGLVVAALIGLPLAAIVLLIHRSRRRTKAHAHPVG